MQPRNYFTDAAEWFLKRNPEPSVLTANEYEMVRKKIEHWSENGIFFALPVNGMFDLGDITAGEVLGEGMLNLPYPVCILEYDTFSSDTKSGNELKLIVVVEDIGGEVEVNMMTTLKLGGVWTPPAIICRAKIGETEYELKPMLPWYVHEKEKLWTKGRSFRDDAMMMMETLALRVVYEFLYILRTYHVQSEDLSVPEGLNRKRLKRGQVPLFTYKTLVIGKKKRKSRHLGGTHASPRSHLRRGYYRTSRKGVRHWVQPCMVKGETDGFVHKDYIVEGEAA